MRSLIKIKLYELIGILIVLLNASCSADDSADDSDSISSKLDSEEVMADSSNDKESSPEVFGDKEALVIEETQRIQVAGLDREYRLYVPPNDSAESILILLHGGGGAESPFPQEAEFRRLADEQGVIVALPKGYLLDENESEWQLNTQEGARQDIEFIEAMLNEIDAAYNPSSTRIDAIGYSLGSMFSYELACQLSDRLSSIASFAGTMPQEPIDCASPSPLSILHIHGTDDLIIPYADSWDWKNWPQVGPMRSVAQLGSFWQERFECLSEETSTTSSTELLTYSDCADGVEVEVLSLIGQGHAWPDFIEGRTTPEYLWNFLSQWSAE